MKRTREANSCHVKTLAAAAAPWTGPGGGVGGVGVGGPREPLDPRRAEVARVAFQKSAAPPKVNIQ